MAMHWDVKCDGCDKTDLVHYRYKCLRCANYDLCKVCYENKVETGRHSKNHPFQCLLDRAARELFFAGEQIPDLCADSFTCPFCGKMGHAVKDLVKHMQAKHRGDDTPVICPLCIAVPSADTVRMNNLVNHVSLMHGTGILRMGGGSGANNNNQGRTAGFNLQPIVGGLGGHGSPNHQPAGHLQRSRVLPPLGSRGNHGHGHGDFHWPLGHSLGSSASQEDFYTESILPELSSLSGSMHTMRDTDIDISMLTEHQQQQLLLHQHHHQHQQQMLQQQLPLRRAPPLSLAHADQIIPLRPHTIGAAPLAVEEDFNELETEDINGNDPTSSF